MLNAIERLFWTFQSNVQILHFPISARLYLYPYVQIVVVQPVDL